MRMPRFGVTLLCNSALLFSGTPALRVNIECVDHPSKHQRVDAMSLKVTITNTQEIAGKKYLGLPYQLGGYLQVRRVRQPEILTCPLPGSVNADIGGMNTPFKPGATDTFAIALKGFSCASETTKTRYDSLRLCIKPGYYGLEGSVQCSDWLELSGMRVR
jgi:hypothetical protein